MATAPSPLTFVFNLDGIDMTKNDNAGPASAPATLVVVGAQVIEVLGVRLETADELLDFLAARQIARIELKTVRDDEPDDGRPFYERIGKIIYSSTRFGIDIVRIDGKDVSHPTSTPP